MIFNQLLMMAKYNNSSQPLFKDSTFSHLIFHTIISILQMRKWKFREVQLSEEDHSAGGTRVWVPLRG